MEKGGGAKGDKQLAEEYSRKIAQKAVRLEKGVYSPQLWNQRVAIIAPQLLKEPIEASGLTRIGRTCQTFYFESLEPKRLENIDAILFFSYNAWRYAEQASLLCNLSKKYPLTLIAARDARDAKLKNQAQSIITTVSPTATAFRIVHDRLIRGAVEREVSPEEINVIGMKIWNNECQQQTEQLVYWKEGEQWPSVGIGHFIWPHESYNGPFCEGCFHHVLAFLREEGVLLPKWLIDARYSPWNSAEEFHAQKDSAQMKELRDILVATLPLQAKYMVDRLWESVPKLLRDVSTEEYHHILAQIQRILKVPGGLFALVDYLNFKHEGTALHEEYMGVRWGLKQVLLGMTEMNGPIEDMVTSAKYRLICRLVASPQERNEARWILGWFARLDRYKT